MLGARQKDTLFARLLGVLPVESILTDPVQLKPFQSDGLTAVKEMPGLVVLPQTLDQVRGVVDCCRELDCPIVTRGAGTGLSGGARPLADGVLLVLSKMNRILEVDADNRVAVVEPGVRNLAISEAARSFGLYYAPDPSSQIACSIGGNVAENAGGVHCLKYGLTVNNVLGLKVLTIDGEELRIGGKTLDAPGYDMLALFTGSEGMLGVITEITVKLLPLPETKQVVMAAFDELRDAASVVESILAEGIIPAGLEMMDRLAIEAAEAYVQVGYPLHSAAILLCELDGTPGEVAENGKRIGHIMRQANATEIRVSQNDEERERLWLGRKAAFPAVGRLSPDYYCMDGTIPRRYLGRVLREIGQLAEETGLRVANVFHAGDGNLHPLILYDANTPGELAKAEKLGGRILELCVAVGGTITGEHGVGVEKLDQMCVQFGNAELAKMHGIKAAFDTSSLLNPGKAVPTLSRCAELGGMHVHRGHLPFSNIERF